jgi:hypothetical protein
LATFIFLTAYVLFELCGDFNFDYGSENEDAGSDNGNKSGGKFVLFNLYLHRFKYMYPINGSLLLYKPTNLVARAHNLLASYLEKINWSRGAGVKEGKKRSEAYRWIGSVWLSYTLMAVKVKPTNLFNK